jgi:uncharacterized protein HemX
LSDRVGPITAVFDIGDFQDVTATPPAHATGDNKHLDLPGSAPTPKPTESKNTAADNGSRGGLNSLTFLSISLVCLALVCVGGLAFWYYGQQEKKRSDEARARQLEQQQNEDKKQAQIRRLRGQVSDLSKRLIAATMVAKEKREKMQEKLAEATRNLDEVTQLAAATQISEIEKRCNNISEELQEIEKDLNNSLQGFQPYHSINRDPVKC